MNYRGTRNSLGVLLIFILSVAVLAPLSHAQYFGRNKVQYKKFDFRVMETEHFDIYFYPEMKEAALQASRLAERWYARLSRVLNHNLSGRQPLILYSSSPDFQQTTAIPGVIGEGVGGVTEMFKRRIVLPLGASLEDTDHVIGHELVHAFQYDITSQSRSSYASKVPTALRLPLWMVEGMAEYLSIGSVDPNTAMWMRDATQQNKLPQIKKLTDPRYFPYRYGQAVWAYITGRWGDMAVERLIKAVSRTGDYEAAIQKALGVSVKDLSKDWHESLKNAYSPIEKETHVTDKLSRSLFKGTEEKSINVSPSLSPDGKQIVFLSSRDLFSIDMYLADTETGKIKSRLIKTAVDAHFESLQFIKSSGSWSADGTHFAFAAVSKGQPELVLLNTTTGKREKEISFPELGEILSPAWSPDGKSLVFSAQAGGLTDLFLYDLNLSKLRKLTDDPFAELQPAWSPDGKLIAFVTDRFSTDLSILSVGSYELALMDPSTGEIHRIPGFPGAKNINPQWSPDSESLFFLSDQNGITNVFRIYLVSGKITQITNFYTGISGITAASPALSVAQQSGLLAYSLYEQSHYSLYSLDSQNALLEEIPPARFIGQLPDVLPPRQKPEGEILGLLKNPLFGLPEAETPVVKEYRPKLKLDYVSQPQVAIGVDRYGTYGGGGIALFFSDMLGFHNIASMFQLSSRIEDSAALVGYQNSRNRFNWGGVVQRIPYVIGGFSSGIGTVYNEPAYIEKEYIFRQVNYQLAGFASYPFNQVRRVSLAAGFALIDFQSEVRTRAISMLDGTQIFYEKEKLPSPSSLNFGFAEAALVYDSSFFGATSPILGQSYILEASPYVGTINYLTLLADYRRYVMPVRPFTLAFRILHYGRYGSGAEDPRLYPVFLGYESLVRGYNTGSFSSAESDSEGNYPSYDRLFGSKLVVANIELRFPLFQVLGIGRGYYGVFPVDFITFYDAGVAWDSIDKAWFLGGNRKPVTSAGVGLRVNMFGFAILGVSYVKPFNRPQKEAYFQFTFTPGF